MIDDDGQRMSNDEKSSLGPMGQVSLDINKVWVQFLYRDDDRQSLDNYLPEIKHTKFG